MTYEWEGAEQALKDLGKKKRGENRDWRVVAWRGKRLHSKERLTINEAITDAQGKQKSGWKQVRIEKEGRV